MPPWLIRALSGVMVGFAALLPVVTRPHTSHAQITTDGSLGPAGTLGGPSVTIGSNLGRIRGGNLFHSFGQFNVNTGQSVTFTGPTSIANIVSRVTGGSPSTIDGLLRSTIPEANMFLLNPSGVLFGPNATLDIGGSFHVTTADYIRFPDGGMFPANLASPTVLSVAPPAAFGFLSAAPAPVIVQGSVIDVLPGRSISLVAGDVGIGGGGLLRAPGGRMSLVAVGGPGEATFRAATQSPDVDLRNGVTGGLVLLRGAGLVSDSAVRGGRVVIRGGRLVAEGSVAQVTNAGLQDGDPVGIDINVANDVIVEGSLVQTRTESARGGDIAVRARSITIGAGASVGTFSFGSGTAGSVRLEADTVSVLSPAPGILSRGLGTGDTGAIAITAGLLSIDGGLVQSGITTGRGGDITVDADRVVLAAGGGIESVSVGSGTSASLTIRARDSVTVSGTNSLGGKSHINNAASGGTAGVVTVSTPTLVLDGADVGTIMSTGGGDITLKVKRATLTAGTIVLSINEGAGPGGNVKVTGSESIRLAGGSSVGTSASGSGRPGRVEVSANILSLEDVSNIGSPGSVSGAGNVSVMVDELAILRGSQITAGTLGDGTGGTVTITARRSMTMSGQSDTGSQSTVNSITAGAGDAGDILITTPILMMTDGASIGAGTIAGGRGGDVVVNVGRLRMSGEAQIESTAINSVAPTGPAGTVTVTASGSILLTTQAAITALTNTAANAGTINVSTPRLTVADGAVISGTSAGAGRGGDIVVNTQELVLTTGGRIDSTAQAAGSGGTVTVTADTATIGGREAGTGRSSGLSSNSQASGPGGNVILRAQNVVLEDGGSLQARSTGDGNAGNVTVVAGDSFRSFGGSVTTEAANGEGGNIVMTVARLLHLVDSRVTTSVQGGTGSGGNITIDPQFVILDNSQIQANAFGGPGGNVNIVADTFLSTGSVLSASSALGAPGIVDVQAQITDVTGTLGSLPESVLQAATLLREACRVRVAQGPASSFVLAGRGGLPPGPGALLPSPLPEEAVTAASMPAPLSFSPIVLTVRCR